MSLVSTFGSVGLEIVQMDHASDLALPKYESEGASGADLRAAIDDTLLIRSGTRELIPTGIKVGLEEGYEAQIRPRSGLAYKHGVTVLNSPGTIDSDYRGEIKVLLVNHGEPYVIDRGERIAQIVFSRVSKPRTFVEVRSLSTTERGEGGFGSTGTN